MGKYYQARANVSSRLSSSSRGSASRGGPSWSGRVERRPIKDSRSNIIDSRADARYKLLNQRRDRLPDARDILRQQAKRPEKISPSSIRSREIRSKFDTRNGTHNDKDVRERNSRRGSDSANGYSSLRGRGDARGRVNSGGRNTTSNRRRSQTRNSYNNDSRSRSRSRVGRDDRANCSSRKEPFVVVTGLGNVRKGGQSVRSVNERPRDNRDHFVTNNGHNTLVTLNNEQFRNHRDDPRVERSSSRDRKHSPERKPAYEAIKIKIKNTNYIEKETVDYSRSESNEDEIVSETKSHNSQDNFSFPASLNAKSFLPVANSDDSMDCEAKSEPPRYTQPNVNVSLPTNMYASLMSTRPPALLPNPPASSILTPNSLTSMNGYNSTLNSFKPTGIVVNNFPTGGMYSSNYENMWNSNLTNFYNQKKNGIVPSLANSSPVSKPLTNGPVSKDGYKLLVSNLHPRVTEDDVLELFSDIGPIKRARFIDKGLAEVIYVRIEHAKEAIKKYDLKELDGRQMVIGFADKSYLTSAETNSAPTIYENKYSNNKIDASKPPPPNINVPPPSVITSMNNRPLFSGNPSLIPHAPAQSIATPQNLSLTISNNMTNRNSSNLLSLTQPPAIATNKLSNRFKEKLSQIALPESKHIDKTQSVNGIDASIIQQVLYNKKNTATNPVTFTVKL